MAAVLITLLLTLTAAPQANLTGKWDGTISGSAPDGSARTEQALLILEQKDKTVTGSVGRDEADRHPIVSGSIDGKKVTILAKHARNDREFRIELTLENDELKGTVTVGDQSVQLEAKKRKE